MLNDVVDIVEGVFFSIFTESCPGTDCLRSPVHRACSRNSRWFTARVAHRSPAFSRSEAISRVRLAPCAERRRKTRFGERKRFAFIRGLFSRTSAPTELTASIIQPDTGQVTIPSHQLINTHTHHSIGTTRTAYTSQPPSCRTSQPPSPPPQQASKKTARQTPATHTPRPPLQC